MENSENQAEKKAPTYATFRNSNGQVLNLFFNGGFDVKKNPILSSDGKIAFVAKSTGRLGIYAADGDGRALMDGDKMKAPLFTVGLEKFISGAEAGLSSKGLEPGQGTIVGPRAQEIVDKFKEAVASAVASQAAAADAQHGESQPDNQSPAAGEGGDKPRARRSPKP